MDINSPQYLENRALEPVSLTTDQEELCRRLDDLHSSNGLETRPSDMFRGALFISRVFLRSNPDWIPQAAHSLREIIYPFSQNNYPNKEKALIQYGSAKAFHSNFSIELGRIFGSLTELAHHGNSKGKSVDYSKFTANEFEKLIEDFERIMKDVLQRQIDIHSEIDSILGLNPDEISI